MVRVIFVVRNNICEVIINVCGLKIFSVNGVENEMVMLMLVVSVIMVVYLLCLNFMIFISNIGDVLMKVRIIEMLRVVIIIWLRKKWLSSDLLFFCGLFEVVGVVGCVFFKINKDNISIVMFIIVIVQNRFCYGNLSIIRCLSIGVNIGMMQVILLSNDSILV